MAPVDQEILHLLRGISTKLGGGEPVDVQDLLPKPLETIQQLEELCNRLEDEEEVDFRRKLV